MPIDFNGGPQGPETTRAMSPGFVEGVIAFHEDKLRDENPYAFSIDHTTPAHDWDEGWDSAHAEEKTEDSAV